MDIGKPFTEAATILKREWRIVLPKIVSYIIILILLAVFILLIGLPQALNEYVLAGSGIESFFNVKNISLLLIFGLLAILVDAYFTLMTYNIAAKASGKKRSIILQKNFGSYLLLLILMFLIVSIIIGILAILYLLLPASARSLYTVFAVIILIAVYLVFLLRLTMALPSLVYDDVGALESLKKSFELSKGNWAYYLLCTIITGALSYAAGQVLRLGFSGFGISGLLIILSLLIGLMLLVISSAIDAYSTAFHLKFYEELK